jgi:nitrile hydratase
MTIDSHSSTPHTHAGHAVDQPDPKPEFERLQQAVVTLLEAKGILTAAEITAAIANMEGRSPEQGARIVARAWVDPDFKATALADLKTAAALLGIEANSAPMFVLLENTATVHHVVVCTLCSCYPRAILGRPPAWYKSREYRSRLVRDPRSVLAEFGTVLPEQVELRVVDSTADCRYLVLPCRPADTEDFTEAQLCALVTRDSMIGVTQLTL